MAKKERPAIRVEAYVKIDGKDVNVDTLTPEMRKKVGTALAVRYFNELWRGQAVFTVKL